MSAAMPPHHEVEVKLAAGPAGLGPILAGPTLTAAGIRKTQRLDSVYYDTPDRRLSGRGVSLRVRHKNGVAEQTVKTEGDGVALTRRGEWTVPCPTGQPDPSAFADPAPRDLLGLILPGELQPIVASRIDRTVSIVTVPAAAPGSVGGDAAAPTRVEVAIDSGSIETLDRREEVAEVELELLDGPAVGLFALARTLNREAPLLPALESKAARGFRLAAGTPASHRLLAQEPTLAPDMPALTAFRRIAESCLAQIAGNLPLILTAGPGPEAAPEPVHQMRVGARRFRSALALFKGLLDTEERRVANGIVKGLADLLNDTRDWDVFCAETLPPIAAGLADPAIATLGHRAATVRDRARDGLLAALCDGTATDRLLALEAWLEDLSAQGETHRTAAREPLGHLAAGLLDRRHKAVTKAGRNFADSDLAQRHAVRLAVKKLRYACDFFHSLYPAKRAKPYRKALKALQEDLGRLQDAATATRLVESLDADAKGAARLPLARAGGRVVGWLGHKIACHDDALVADWQRFKRTEPFWR